MIQANIEDLLTEKFKEEEFADCFLIEIKPRGKKKLEVFVDSDSGITFKKCQQISRFLETHIEEGKWMDDKYTLEVSSPGIGRPLRFRRQYPRNIGRILEVTVRDEDKARKGKLIAVNDEDIVLEETVTVKQGKKKIKEKKETQISFSAIEKAIVKISF